VSHLRNVVARLLKGDFDLHAGGARDAWDVRASLEAVDDEHLLTEEIERLLPALPAESRRLWERIRGE
jgi:uncharacterized protein (DUF2267 family)